MRRCHLSPHDVDEMGWLDLIALTLMADGELNASKQASNRAKEAELAAMAGVAGR